MVGNARPSHRGCRVWRNCKSVASFGFRRVAGRLIGTSAAEGVHSSIPQHRLFQRNELSRPFPNCPALRALLTRAGPQVITTAYAPINFSQTIAHGRSDFSAPERHDHDVSDPGCCTEDDQRVYAPKGTIFHTRKRQRKANHKEAWTPILIRKAVIKRHSPYANSRFLARQEGNLRNQPLPDNRINQAHFTESSTRSCANCPGTTWRVNTERRGPLLHCRASDRVCNPAEGSSNDAAGREADFRHILPGFNGPRARHEPMSRS